MSDKDIIKQTIKYYRKRASLHDTYMNYSSLANTEKLLGALVRLFIRHIQNKNILEIACGTGTWTQVLAKYAKSVLATDSSPEMLKIAKKKCENNTNISFFESDAYQLNNVNQDFDVSFSADWWSHIPKSKIYNFLLNLHSKLHTGAQIIFIDMLPNSSLKLDEYQQDEDSNLFRIRKLPDDSEYKIIKNFPSKEELTTVLKPFVNDFKFYQHQNLKRWLLIYSRSDT